MTRSDRFAAACSAAVLCALAPPAAVAADLPGGLQAKAEADIDLVLAPDPAAAQSGPYGAVALRWSADAVRASGLRWGLDVAGEALTGDGRRGLARALPDCPAGPRAPDGRARAGLVSGLSGPTGGAPASGQAGLSQASLWVQTGFVRLRAGIAEGAAGQERPDLPGALRTLRADGGLIDPTGLALADTGLSLAGPAPGLSIQSRRLIGLRATASYTPGAGWRSVGRARAAGPDLAQIDVRDVWALAASFDRRSPQSGVRWRAYAGAETARAAGPDAALMRDPWVVSARIARSSGDVSLGLAWLKTNDGLPGADYEAVSASAALERGDWLFSAEASAARAGLARRDGRTLQRAASRLVGDHAVIGLAASLGQETGAGMQDRRRARLALEAGLRF
ncbi:MAG: porin [Oceanicaulis sp.]|nr:porin [Oceanicaulis sp.]